MKKIILLALILIFGLGFTSGCSGYVNRLYNQMDRDENQGTKRASSDQFGMYRRKNKSSNAQAKNQYQDKVARLSSADTKVVDPAVKRQYTPQEEAKKRYKAEDLQDNSGSGSLWTGEGKDNSLFVSKNEKQNGDIVVINVMANLKNEITNELKKAYPAEASAAPKAAAAQSTPDKTAAAPATGEKPAAGTEDNATDQTRVYDKISSVIIEEINRDHILLRGRKTLLYNNRKVTVEVQALAPRKSIAEDDSVDSNSILESSIRVVR